MFPRSWPGRARPGPTGSDRSSPCGLESLESRRFFSVTVAEGYPGFFEVQGDEADDTISISVSQNEESFTLDGVTYTGVSYIAVSGGAGNDTISVISIDGSGSVAAGLLGDSGDDTLSLNFDGATWGGSGMDLINISDSFYGQVYGDEGDDTIMVSGACVSADIDGGAGDDLINCTQNLAGVVVYGGNGSDTIYGSPYDDQIYGGNGADMLYGGKGNDTIYAHNGAADSVDGGGGYDVVYADSSGEGSICDVEQVFYG